MLTAHMTVAMTLGVVQLVLTSTYSQSAQRDLSAEQLVVELRQFRASLSGIARSNGVPDPTEERRAQVYRQLLELGSAALPALNDGLADPDVQLRRNVALFLNAAAGGWYDRAS